MERGIGRAVAACLLCLLALGVIAAYAALDKAVWPEATGEKVQQKGSLTIDVSSMENGYILAKSDLSKAKLKLRIAKGDMHYDYDLTGDDQYVVFPLQMGSGKYTVTLFKNVKGKKYAKDGEVKLTADIGDENAPFLAPSQYVDYTPETAAVLKSDELCSGLNTDREKVEAIRLYMKENFLYDYIRAVSAPKSYLGDIEGCFETKQGLCQDFAAVAACMLRVQGIPTQLVIGYAGATYHAWNLVMVDGQYEMLDITAEVSGGSGGVEYTAERFY